MFHRPHILAVGMAILTTASLARAQVITAGRSATATSINVTTLSTGTVLQVSPSVSPDRRYVGMSVGTQFSTLDGSDTFVLTKPPTGGVFVGGNGSAPAASAIRAVPFRAAQVNRVTFVDNDHSLLAVRIAAVQLKAVSFKDAVRKLADMSNENLVLGIRGLEQAGVDVNGPQDFSIPAGSIKDALLAVVQKAAPHTDLVITAEDKVITISTQAQADHVLVTKTYDLADLLANLPRFVAGGTNLDALGSRPGHDDVFFEGTDLNKPPPPPAAIQITTTPTSPRANSTEAHGLARTIMPANARPSPIAPPRANRSASTDIAELITSTVRPDIWKKNGGTAEIYIIGDHVTIKAPASVHALLAGPKYANPGNVNSYILYGQ